MSGPFGQIDDIGRWPSTSDLPYRQQPIELKSVNWVNRDDPTTDAATVKVDAHHRTDHHVIGTFLRNEIVERPVRSGRVTEDAYDSGPRTRHSPADGSVEVVEARERLPTEP